MGKLRTTYFIDLLNEFNMYEDGDMCGSVVSCLFDVCAFLYQNDVNIPEEWKYRPGASGDPQVETFDFIEQYPLEDVLNFGHHLYFMKCFMEMNELDY